MKIIDLNVLLYAVNSDSEQHDAVRRWWEIAINGDESLGLPWVVLLGFLRISTNPRIFPLPLEPAAALQRIESWLSLDIVTLVAEKPEQWTVLRGLLEASGIAGNLTTDAHLAAVAITHGATLASCDRDFARFAGLRWENPVPALQ